MAEARWCRRLRAQCLEEGEVDTRGGADGEVGGHSMILRYCDIVTVLANISFLIVELYLIHQRPVCFALAVSSATNILVQH